jgi:hypothetical protein
MFSVQKKKDENMQQRLADIDKELSEIPIYQYVLRQDLKDEKKNILEQLKEKYVKEEESHPLKKNLVAYNPTELYKEYHDQHKDRQLFRQDKSRMLRLQIKYKHSNLRKLIHEIEDLNHLLEVTEKELDHSS